MMQVTDFQSKSLNGIVKVFCDDSFHWKGREIMLKVTASISG